MAYNFKVVDIVVFDVHTAVKPITHPILLKEPFGFLVNKERYNEQFKLQKSVESDNYIVQPVTRRARERNHFWKNYIQKDDSSIEPDYYDLRIPFIFKPLNFNLFVDKQSYPFVSKVTVFVYLTSTGWSSNIKMSLNGDISSAQLRDFIGALRSKEGFPFLISDKKHRLASVFRNLEEIVRDTIYQAPEKAGDKLSVPYRYFISLARTIATPKFYNDKHKTKSQKDNALMTSSDQAELLSILHGSVIKADSTGKYEKGTLLTMFKDTDFALTDFDLGTLLFMQEEASQPAPKVKRLKCMVSNMSNCTVMNLMLLHFQFRFKEFPQKDLSLNELFEKTERLLKLIHYAYDNGYCQSFYQNHGSLKTYNYGQII